MDVVTREEALQALQTIGNAGMAVNPDHHFEQAHDAVVEARDRLFAIQTLFGRAAAVDAMDAVDDMDMAIDGWRRAMARQRDEMAEVGRKLGSALDQFEGLDLLARQAVGMLEARAARSGRPAPRVEELRRLLDQFEHQTWVTLGIPLTPEGPTR